MNTGFPPFCTGVVTSREGKWACEERRRMQKNIYVYIKKKGGEVLARVVVCMFFFLFFFWSAFFLFFFWQMLSKCHIPFIHSLCFYLIYPGKPLLLALLLYPPRACPNSLLPTHPGGCLFSTIGSQWEGGWCCWLCLGGLVGWLVGRVYAISRQHSSRRCRLRTEEARIAC